MRRRRVDFSFTCVGVLVWDCFGEFEVSLLGRDSRHVKTLCSSGYVGRWLGSYVQSEVMQQAS